MDASLALQRQRKNDSFIALNYQQKRSRAKEIAEKLETVTELLNAITAHLVPLERTFGALNFRCISEHGIR
ncbi:hypothetical protein FDP11_18955 [Vibrio parahaemolyticus]|nr:hypothetical protein FDP11_18955 [Vibrio parahaemolyticus]